jgi:hypothetical protein
MFLLASKYVFAITPLYLLPVLLVGVLSVFAILVSVLIFMTFNSWHQRDVLDSDIFVPDLQVVGFISSDSGFLKS